MGNTVSASSPAEVRTIESYLSESCENVESLGSTRFMKVAKARGENGYLKTYKLFINLDETLTMEALSKYQENLMNIGKILSKEPNCLPNKGKDSTLLVRSYQKYTLFDRLSTRPFLNDQERIWYIYQLFKALNQCQKANVCHGDLKSQNVLLSSTNWLQITDFASFKPTFIQLDNPSFFTFFFDTSRRQSCYLAPERLLSSVEFEKRVKENEKKGNDWLFESLTPAMDMFSAGCVVYELLCEGKSPFSYGQLCEYQMQPAAAAQSLSKLLEDVPVKFRALLKVLLNREPSMRTTAQKVLEGDAFNFPPFLEWYYIYLAVFRPIEAIEEISSKSEADPSMFWVATRDPDYIISKLVIDEQIIFKKLKESEESRSYAVLVISLITANLRSLKGAQSKVNALRLLVKLSYLCDCTIALERVLPFFVFMLSDQHVTVRVAAIHSIVDLIKPLEPTNIEQSLIFMDYIIPELSEIIEKKNPPGFVIQTLASNLGFIAQCAHRFHTVGWGLRSNQDDECSGTENLDQARNRKEELDTLVKSIAELFTPLCISGNIIRHCLINLESLAALFKFFNTVDNKEDNNILIKHMITFLNSKVDWRLRAAVFDALPICLQKRTVDMRALLQQGLHDFEEIVVARVLHCIHSLIEKDLLERHAVVALLGDVAPFLAHPNKWIRVFVVNIVVLLDSRWSIADVNDKLRSHIKDYLQTNMFRFNSKVVIMESLKKPIPRGLWKQLMNDLNDEQMKMFCEKLERAVKDGGPVQMSEHSNRKIIRIEDDNELKRKLYRFKDHLIKMAEFRKSAGMESELTMRKGKIDLTAHEYVRRHEHIYGRKKLSSTAFDASLIKNQEWNEMFAQHPEAANQERQNSTIQAHTSACGSQLQNLLSHKESLYIRGKGAHQETGFIHVPSSSFSKISGTLLTHLHEHTDKIAKIATSSEHQRIMTVSADGSIKIWNERSLIGESFGPVRSESTLNPSQAEQKKTPLTDGDWVDRGQRFAVTTRKGEVIIIDLASSSESDITKIQLPKEDGSAEAIHTDNNIMFVRSLHGSIYCLDRRVGKSNGLLGKHEVWSRKIDPSHGLVSSSCIDPWKSNWMVLSVTNNQLLLWDLRYQMEAKVITSRKTSSVPVKLWNNPCSSYADPEIFVAENLMGDVSVFDIARSSRTRVLWSSLCKPLTYKVDLTDGVITRALCVNNDTGEVFTGDSQGSLRKWNLKKPHYSEYLSGNRKNQENEKVKFQESIVKDSENEEAVPVIKEYRTVPQSEEQSLPTISSMDIKGSTCHRTSISDMVCIGRDLLISASSDGVIKCWK